MKKIIYILLLLPIALSGQDIGGQYYVAPDGNDSDAGTYAAPWATFQKAFDEAMPGDTVYFRGGTYMSDGPNYIRPEREVGAHGNSGTEEAWIYYWNYPGEKPILDCRLHCSENPTLSYNTGIDIEHAAFMHFRGITIRNVYQCSDVISSAFGASYGANFIFENITIHNIGERGWQVFSGAWNEWDRQPGDPAPYYAYDSTYWINCDVYDICDTMTAVATGPGNAGDGWKCHTYDGVYFSWEGCRAWNYSDDGFDPSGGGVREFNNCWAMSSDKYAFIADVPGGYFEGNGIKTAAAVDTLMENGYVDEPLVIVKNCLAMFCNGYGFYNNLEGNIQNEAVYYNNTAWKNDISFGTSSKGVIPIQEVYRNNLSYDPIDINATGRPTHIAIISDQYIYANNTWYGKWYTSDTITATDADFVVSDSATLVSLFTAPRGANNELPTFPIRLVAGSDLIDAGGQPEPRDSVNFTLSYLGEAPDIGAWEWRRGSVLNTYSKDGVKQLYWIDGVPYLITVNE